MSDIWNNCFCFVLVTSRKAIVRKIKIVMKFICPNLDVAVLFLLLDGVPLFYYLSIIIADQNMPFHGQAPRHSYWLNFYLADSAVCASHQIIQMMCAMFGDCHMFPKLSCSFFTKMDIPILKHLARHKGFNSIFDWITQPQLSYCLIGLALAGTWHTHMFL